jgi:tetratricopeptide (TPR) repeat protein
MPSVSELKRQPKVVLYRASIRCMQSGDYDNAIRYCSALIDVGFSPATSYMNRGLARCNKGNYQAAIIDLDEVIQVSGSNQAIRALAFSNRGHCQRQQGNIEAAIADCTNAIELASHWFPGHHSIQAFARMNRGLAYSTRGAHDQALEDCERALALASGLPRHVQSFALADRGSVLGMMGDSERALADFEAALALADNLPYPKAWAYGRRGLVHSARGATEDAIRDLTLAIEAAPQLVDPYQARGNQYTAKGDTQRAAADYQKVEALRADPSGPVDHEELIRLARAVNNRQLFNISVALFFIVILMAMLIQSLLLAR